MTTVDRPASIEAASASAWSADNALYRRVAWHLMPILMLCYIISNLDRVNISFAKVAMMSDLGFNDAVYGLGAGLFFIGYALVEVPSNLLLHRYGARVWIARILFTWGVISAAMSIVNSAWSFYVLRLALGVAEAGLFPGMIYYLTQWYPRSRRATITSVLYIAMPVAGVSGSLLSGLIIAKLDRALGLAGWQWMFILEALPAILLAPVVFFLLPDRIATARWLQPKEQRRLAQNLTEEAGTPGTETVAHVLRTLRVWHFGLILFVFVLALYGIFFFMPALIHGAGATTPLLMGALTAVPYAAAIVIMPAVSHHSDRTGERRWPLIGASVVGAAGIAASVLWKHDIVVVVIGMSLAVSGIITVLPVFLSIATGAFQGASEAAAIAFVNSLGLLGGFVAPAVIGAISSWSGSTSGGMYLITFCWLSSGILVLAVPARPTARPLAVGREAIPRLAP